jgi:hypothetical protein
MMSRSTARAVLPPLLALGLVALVTRPIDAPEPVLPASTSTFTTVGARTTGLVGTTGTSGAAPSVSVTVPAVSFTDSVVASGGRLRVPVLLTDPTVTARATIESTPGCGVDLQQGVVGWIDCAVTTQTRLVVQLSDGRAYSHVVAVA